MHISPGRILALLLFLIGWALPAAALEPPELTRYVTDLAGVLSPGDLDHIEQLLRQYDEATSSQFVVLILPSLEGESLEDFSMRVAEKNRIGREGKDNGLLFLVAVNDRKMRFEVGYGLEGVLTDAATSLIISDMVAPQFRSGNYAQGIYDGMQTAIKISTGEFKVSERSQRRENKDKDGNVVGLIIFLVIMFIIIKGNKGRGGRGGGIWFIGGPFGGSGFGGGGFGGGGGFSGFSGGGGGFGGGGSSGSW
ncbi:MAG: TPM domain-containing protein [Bacteroidetes bacterium]|nr:TPM domain-containing protein [Bacteroidota bacterium]